MCACSTTLVLVYDSGTKTSLEVTMTMRDGVHLTYTIRDYTKHEMNKAVQLSIFLLFRSVS